MILRFRRFRAWFSLVCSSCTRSTSGSVGRNGRSTRGDHTLGTGSTPTSLIAAVSSQYSRYIHISIVYTVEALPLAAKKRGKIKRMRFQKNNLGWGEVEEFKLLLGMKFNLGTASGFIWIHCPRIPETKRNNNIRRKNKSFFWEIVQLTKKKAERVTKLTHGGLEYDFFTPSYKNVTKNSNS